MRSVYKYILEQVHQHKFLFVNLNIVAIEGTLFDDQVQNLFKRYTELKIRDQVI